MIIVNGVPKSGTTLLQQYLVYCGLQLEPGGLMHYQGATKMVMRGGKPWGEVRSLQAVLEDFSRDKVIGGHVCASARFPKGHTIAFIYRNPRDILVSQARWRAVRMDWTDITKQPSFDAVKAKMNESLVKTVLANERDFKGWMTKADLLVAFENLVKAPEITGKQICQTLGIGYKNPADILGDKTLWVTDTYRGTWSGQLSSWRDFWDSVTDKWWRQHGGYELEAEYGYQCEP